MSGTPVVHAVLDALVTRDDTVTARIPDGVFQFGLPALWTAARRCGSAAGPAPASAAQTSPPWPVASGREMIKVATS